MTAAAAKPPHERAACDAAARSVRPGASAREGQRLPMPGPDLHSAMFHDLTLREVARLEAEIRELRGLGDAAPEGALLLALEELEVYVVDCTILAKTGIGKTVKTLTKNSDKEVVARADALVGQWKKDYDTRKLTIKGFREKGGLQEGAAREMEAGLFREATPLGILEGDGYRSYIRHYKRLCAHLRDTSEGSLVRRVEEGQIALLEVASLPDEELQSAKRRRQITAAEQEGLRNAMGGTTEVEGTVTDAFRCPKCESSKTFYKEVQSGWHNDQQDMTIIVQCLDCGARWKEGDDHGLAGS
eukprot:TRINITY_DN54190_c0_g1_i1.p1 TRINITY_DN54190_c0_g1~~TRINITY_DN54190_c0_g1_i1.p1  ORF type:complete len:301 (-),score=84.21 TRINITY_DN54190_c0_g1_i1:77-979(-)